MRSADGSYDFFAQGHLGQRIYVAPQNNTVMDTTASDEPIPKEVASRLCAEIRAANRHKHFRFAAFGLSILLIR